MTDGTSIALEQRYRKLLRWYPLAHRQAYGDEIIGVLLSAARPGQHRPGPRDAFDVVRGGLLIRVQRLRRGPDGAPWRDALALVSLLAPLIMLAAAIRYAVEVAVMYPQVRPHLDTGAVEWSSFLSSAGTWLAWAIVAVLALLAQRRAAGLGALIVGGSMLVPFVARLFGLMGDLWWLGGSPSGALMGVLAGAALLGSAGPRRAKELMGRGALMLTLAVVALFGLLTSRGLLYLAFEAYAWEAFKYAPLLAAALIAPWLLRSAAGRRAAALLIMPFGPIAMGFLPYIESSLIHVLLAMVVLPALLPASVMALNLLVERGRRMSIG